MRKTLFVIVLLAALVGFSSAFNGEDIDSKVGSFAPNITVENSDKTFRLSQFRGKYVVVNFWSADNAEWRIRNIEMSKFVGKHSDKIVYASINFDRSYSLFNETIKIDNLDNSAQFFEKDGIISEVYKQFHLENGLNCYLISPEGRIEAVNPDVRQLAEI